MPGPAPLAEASPGRIRLAELAWLPIVFAALLVAYLPGLGNALVYDDDYLVSGLFDEYRSLLPLRQRFLSYGSFVWVHALAGDGWWIQRLVNLAIHAAVVVAVWAFYREILRRIEPPAGEDAPATPYFRSPALGFAVGFFALNPVAVYAVAYLIQRSILLATLFVTLGLWLVARAFAAKRPWLLAAALACYALAMASKGHALFAPIAAIPVYVVMARPGPRRLLLVSLAGIALVALAALALAPSYGSMVGKPFDEYSHVYLAQLAQLNPNASKHAYALSVMNEAWLFFRYGFEWIVPWSGTMSINLRPPFPVDWLSFPQTLGAIGYVALVAGGFALVIRFRDWRGFAGFALLLPALLFPTEFATVWVQDPFVLYRSYLWAIGIPGLVFIAVHGPSGRVLLVAGVALGCLLVWQALDRVVSLRNAESAWSDAIAKLPRDPRSVGRWFPYLNRGAAYVDSHNLELAARDFEASSTLGDLGMGAFNLGSVLAARGKPREALAAFDRAQAQGYSIYNLPFQRGLALAALGRTEEALKQFELTKSLDPPSPTREITLLQLGRTALKLRRRKEAIEALEQLAKIDPANREGRFLLSTAYLMDGAPARALPILDRLVMEHGSGPEFQARAVANYQLGRRGPALADIEAAIRIGPDSPALHEWRAKILMMR